MKKLFEIPSAEYVEVADVIVTSGGSTTCTLLGGGSTTCSSTVNGTNSN